MQKRELLLEMLSYRRPHGSRSERKFINRFIRPPGAAPDAFGNYILRVGTAPILWSAHTDTVHNIGGRQSVTVDDDVAYTVDRNSNCLGADCTTGVWFMLEMIRAGVEGLYIFHRAEEVGCRGSNYIAVNTPEILEGIDYAIAFDRRGYDSIVTHQMGQRTASDAFARSLAGALAMPQLEPDAGGVFTDTVEYAHLIPECTNLSVGYFQQHSARETQDLAFAEHLLGALLQADFSQLLCAHDIHPKPDPFGVDPNWWEDDFSAEPVIGAREYTGDDHDPSDPYWWDHEDGLYRGEEPLIECDNCGIYTDDTYYYYANGRVCPDCIWELIEGVG